MKNYFFIILIIFIKNEWIINSKKIIPKTNKCYSDIMKNYELSGINEAIKKKINICPTLESTCCNIADEKILINKWDIIKKKYEYHYNTYIKLINFTLGYFEEVTNLANTVKDKYSKNQVCLDSSNKILDLKLDFKKVKDVTDSIIKQIKHIKSLREKSLCIICDSKSHELSIMNDKTNKEYEFFLSKEFCKKLVNGTIDGIYSYNNLVHPYLVNLNNLIECELQKNNIEKPKDKPWDDLKIEECKNKHKDENFFYCEKICESYTIGNLSSYLDGENKILKETYFNIKNYKTRVFKNPGNNVLKIDNEKNIEEYIGYLEKNNDFAIIVPKNNNMLSFDKIKPSYVDNDGYNPYSISKVVLKQIYIDSLNKILLMGYCIIYLLI